MSIRRSCPCRRVSTPLQFALAQGNEHSSRWLLFTRARFLRNPSLEMTMAVREQNQNWISVTQTRTYAIAALVVFVLIVIVVPEADAQTFAVLYDFTDQSDGGKPGAGMTVGRDGKFYGTTQYGGDLLCDLGGIPGCGVLFEFSNPGSGWRLTPLHDFDNGAESPYPGVPAIGRKGNLYDITNLGGVYRSGTIFEAIPRPGAWRFKMLHRFTGGSDGGAPTRLDPLLFDSSGNVYGAATYGGSTNSGVVYELTPASGVWTEKVLYSFTGDKDGSHLRGITFDGQGNIYGVAAYSGGNQDCGFGYGCGTVYKLTHSQSGWGETTLHTFRQGVDGGWPGPLIRDKAGNLYGITEGYGPKNNGGTVWKMSPSNGGWTFRVLHAFATETVDDFGPYPLTMDDAGNLYGITNWGGANNEGLLFKLTPANGRWKYTDLHDFGQDGCYPQGAVIRDAGGRLYGTAESCGKYDYGVIWEFTP
jgi:uncharacterized repeat protein (TIGR03803 family)